MTPIPPDRGGFTPPPLVSREALQTLWPSVAGPALSALVQALRADNRRGKLTEQEQEEEPCDPQA